MKARGISLGILTLMGISWHGWAVGRSQLSPPAPARAAGPDPTQPYEVFQERIETGLAADSS